MLNCPHPVSKFPGSCYVVQLKITPWCRMSERQGPEDIDCSCIKLSKPHQKRKKAGLIFEKSAEEPLIPCTGNSSSPTRTSDLNTPIPVSCSSQQGTAKETNCSCCCSWGCAGISQASPERSHQAGRKWCCLLCPSLSCHALLTPRGSDGAPEESSTMNLSAARERESRACRDAGTKGLHFQRWGNPPAAKLGVFFYCCSYKDHSSERITPLFWHSCSTNTFLWLASAKCPFFFL